MNRRTIGFVGTGRIARALVSGLSQDPDNDISGYDKLPGAAEALAEEFGITVRRSTRELAENARIVILAVKPYQMEEVLGEVRGRLDPDHLLISVAAGVTTGFIRSHTREEMRIVRAMPNTPAFVGEGMTALCAGERATAADVALAETIFSSIGGVAVLDESLMDAATAVSGSGPAYMFRIVASIAEGGVQCGLGSAEAVRLAARTMLGAAKMVLESKKSPEELVREVTTPGGTTEAGLQQMEQHDIRRALIETVRAAARRSGELKQ